MIAPFKASLKHGGGIHLTIIVLHVNYEYENLFIFWGLAVKLKIQVHYLGIA